MLAGVSLGTMRFWEKLFQFFYRRDEGSHHSLYTLMSSVDHDRDVSLNRLYARLAGAELYLEPEHEAIEAMITAVEQRINGCFVRASTRTASTVWSSRQDKLPILQVPCVCVYA